jgi:hypothetical protein
MWKWWQERQEERLTSRVINETEKSIRENKRYLAQLYAPGPVSTSKIEYLIHYTDRFIQDFDEKNPDIAEQISKKRSGFWWRLANAAAADYLKKYGDYDPVDALGRMQKAEFGVPANASGGLTLEQTYKRILKKPPDEPGIFERMTDFLAKRRKAVTALSLSALVAGITVPNVVDAGEPYEHVRFKDHYIAIEHKGKIEISKEGETCPPIHFREPVDYYSVNFYGIVENEKPWKWDDWGGIIIRIVDARFPSIGHCRADPIDGKYDERLELVNAKFYYYYDPDLIAEDKLDISPELTGPDADCWIDFEKFNNINLKNLPNLSAPVPEKFLKDPKSPKYQPVIDELRDNLGLVTAIVLPSVLTPIVLRYWLGKKKKDSAS